LALSVPDPLILFRSIAAIAATLAEAQRGR